VPDSTTRCSGWPFRCLRFPGTGRCGWTTCASACCCAARASRLSSPDATSAPGHRVRLVLSARLMRHLATGRQPLSRGPHDQVAARSTRGPPRRSVPPPGLHQQPGSERRWLRLDAGVRTVVTTANGTGRLTGRRTCPSTESTATERRADPGGRGSRRRPVPLGLSARHARCDDSSRYAGGCRVGNARRGRRSQPGSPMRPAGSRPSRRRSVPGWSVITASTPRESTNSMSSGRLTVQTCTCAPTRWARRT
jgi:hypothetical protein